MSAPTSPPVPAQLQPTEEERQCVANPTGRVELSIDVVGIPGPHGPPGEKGESGSMGPRGVHEGRERHEGAGRLVRTEGTSW